MKNEFALVIRDAYPVSPGHTLVIPRRHMASMFEASVEEQRDLFALLDKARRELEVTNAPAGFNICVNDGPAAGQTVPHLHVHLIPRYPDDIPDPRGGVRWLFPEKARYWQEARVPDEVRDAGSGVSYISDEVTTIPTSAEQLAFLKNIQRLFEEGDFTATYKYALLMALIEIAVEQGDDSGAALTISRCSLGEKFAEYYWPQTLPFKTGQPGVQPGILSQNLGGQAAVVNRLLVLRRAGVSTLADARQLPQWREQVRQIEAKIFKMPVRFLQNVGGDRVEFLYRQPVSNDAVELLPGVAYNLRRFQGFLNQLARSGWIAHVRRNNRNGPLLGEAADLDTFMFQASRQSLLKAGEFLRDLQNNRCFYCELALREKPDVDHFVPWAQYPRDTAHNFVLAHSSCNRSKCDALAGKRHLERWLERNGSHDSLIHSEMTNLGFVADATRSLAISRWAYSNAVDIGANAWVAAQSFEPVGPAFLELLC